MIKLGLTIAAAAAVLTTLVTPVNAGCRTITKSVETDDRTITQKTKVCDNRPQVIVVQPQPVPLIFRPVPRPLILVR